MDGWMYEKKEGEEFDLEAGCTRLTVCTDWPHWASNDLLNIQSIGLKPNKLQSAQSVDVHVWYMMTLPTKFHDSLWNVSRNNLSIHMNFVNLFPFIASPKVFLLKNTWTKYLDLFIQCMHKTFANLRSLRFMRFAKGLYCNIVGSRFWISAIHKRFSQQKKKHLQQSAKVLEFYLQQDYVVKCSYQCGMIKWWPKSTLLWFFPPTKS